MDLNAEALREIADWLDLTDQYIKDTLVLVEPNRGTMHMIAMLEGSDMQYDLRRWAEEMNNAIHE